MLLASIIFAVVGSGLYWSGHRLNLIPRELLFFSVQAVYVFGAVVRRRRAYRLDGIRNRPESRRFHAKIGNPGALFFSDLLWRLCYSIYLRWLCDHDRRLEGRRLNWPVLTTHRAGVRIRSGCRLGDLAKPSRGVQAIDDQHDPFRVCQNPTKKALANRTKHSPAGGVHDSQHGWVFQFLV